jgi:hypothetical protein
MPCQTPSQKPAEGPPSSVQQAACATVSSKGFLSAVQPEIEKKPTTRTVLSRIHFAIDFFMSLPLSVNVVVLARGRRSVGFNALLSGAGVRALAFHEISKSPLGHSPVPPERIRSPETSDRLGKNRKVLGPFEKVFPWLQGPRHRAMGTHDEVLILSSEVATNIADDDRTPSDVSYVVDQPEMIVGLATDEAANIAMNL